MASSTSCTVRTVRTVHDGPAERPSVSLPKRRRLGPESFGGIGPESELVKGVERFLTNPYRVWFGTSRAS